MASFLLAWNPTKWAWDDEDEPHTLVETVARYRRGEAVSCQWSCGRNKSIRAGDTVFLIRLGKEPKGIFAHGTVFEPSFEEEHWGDPGKTSIYVRFSINSIVHPEMDEIISMKALQSVPFSQTHWSIQGSGVRISDVVASDLLASWSSLISTYPLVFADDIDTSETYPEGASRLVTVNAYERNAAARKACIDRYKAICAVCDFDFGKVYGEVGRDLIHVHHLKTLASIGKAYRLNPIKDLRPVCPNCHAIIHRRTEPFTIDEVKQFIQLQRSTAIGT